ncbi:MAG: hypothetical protein ACFCVK_18190 [Acidimicrobiales bacterium]
MTTTATIDATAVPILEIGRAWMTSPHTAAAGEALGLHGFGFWVNGRAGVLGPVDADIAAAALGFMHPATVRAHWEGRPPELTPAAASAAYAGAAATWGRRSLAGIEEGDLADLVTLTRTVAEAAQPSVGALFAGWRALSRPDDPAGEVAMLLNVLRELRGGAHLSAVQAAGLGPLGAIVSFSDPVRGGSGGAERFGWPAPHPVPSPEDRARAEAMTTVICQPAYDVLDAEAQRRLVELVLRVRSAVGA